MRFNSYWVLGQQCIHIKHSEKISIAEGYKIMPNFDIENSPFIENFKDLQRGETVYSKKYGLDQVHAFYNDEIIIQFSSLRKRFSPEDKEIRSVPQEFLSKRKSKVLVTFDGEEMSFRKYKEKTGQTKEQIKATQLKYLTLNEVLDILSINKARLLKLLSENAIQTKTFGKKVMIHRDDAVKLSKTI